MGYQAALQYMYVLYQAQIRSFIIPLWKIFQTFSSSLLSVGSHLTVEYHTRTYSRLQFGTPLSFTLHLHWVSSLLFTRPTLSEPHRSDNACLQHQTYFIEHDLVCFYSCCWNGRISFVSYGGMVFMCTHIHTYIQMSNSHSPSVGHLPCFFLATVNSVEWNLSVMAPLVDRTFKKKILIFKYCGGECWFVGCMLSFVRLWVWAQQPFPKEHKPYYIVILDIILAQEGQISKWNL